MEKTKTNAFRALIGSRKFYKQFIMIAIPIIIQQLIINSATIIDNFMVGKLAGGAEAMGVVFAIVFVPTFLMFSTSHGAGVYISQYFGAADKDNLDKAIGIKIRNLLIMSFVVSASLVIFAPQLASIFTDTQSVIADASAYLRIYGLAIIPIYLGYGIASSFVQVGKPAKTL
jgi:Na+-driven multidrug efflux pump